MTSPSRRREEEEEARRDYSRCATHPLFCTIRPPSLPYWHSNVRYDTSCTLLLDDDNDVVMIEWERLITEAHASVLKHGGKRVHFTDLEDFNGTMVNVLDVKVYSFFNGLASDNLFSRHGNCRLWDWNPN